MNTSFSPAVRTALVLGLIASSVASQSLMGQYGEVVLAAGDAAPGIPGWNIYGGNAFGFGSPVIDQNGTILVQSRLEPAGTEDRAIFIGRSYGDLQVVAQSGSQAPGLPPGTLLRSSSTSSGAGLENDPLISPLGEFVFFGSAIYDPITPANTPSTSDSALFWWSAGTGLLIAREGEQAPGVPAGVTFGSTSFSRQYNKINRNGLVAFGNDLGGTATTADDAALFSGFPGSIELVAREGDPAPLGGGETWAAASGGTMSFLVAMNEAGQVVFQPSIDGATVTSADNSVLATWQSGVGATIWAREGDQAPGFAPGVVLFSTPSTNSANWDHTGNMAFLWNIDDGGATVSSNNDTVIWYGGAGGFAPMLREGDPTGFAGGEMFGNFNNSSVTSARMQDGTVVLAFLAINLRDASGVALPSGNDTAMVIGTPGNWTEVVREGAVVAAIPPSVNGPWTAGNVSGSTYLNTRGQLMFNQSCSDGVTTQTFYLCYDPVHGLQVLQDATETYTTSIGTGTATSSVSLAGTQGNSDNGSLSFSNSGDTTFRQSIDNGLQAAIVRGHCGSFYATPAAFPSATGGTQNWTIDLGPGAAPRIWIALASESGTRPGFPSPLGAGLIPLNIDAATQLSLDVAGQGGYANIGVTLDGTATGGLTLPPGYGVADMHHAVIMLDLTLMSQEISEPVGLRRY